VPLAVKLDQRFAVMPGMLWFDSGGMAAPPFTHLAANSLHELSHGI
jgi:hypothetical protein